MQITCGLCGHSSEVSLPVSRNDECPACRGDLRCCKSCQFYDETASNSCREPQADRVTEKEKANFCDYFSPCNKAHSSPESRESIFAAAEAIFRKPPSDQ